MKQKEYYSDPVAAEGKLGFGIRKPELSLSLPYLGTLQNKTADDIVTSNWMLGCETLDRDYADYDSYKEYLVPLGIKLLRLQGGWAKTEKVRGSYEWEWLDHIVNDATARGLRPWLQTGYGNLIYPGAGGENLGAGMPLSVEGMAAYEKWVAAMVTRYADRVSDWEVWNEPNFGDNTVNTPEISAEFNLRTAKIIKSIQPEARISALALGHINLDYVERFFRYLQKEGGCEYFHDVTYHDYVYNPDSNKQSVSQMRQIVEKYAPGLIMRQGENGAPSEPKAGGALADYEWSELSQAKWDTRRMLENLGNDIECSVFSIAEMQYDANGPIRKTNTKGLLKTNAQNKVLRPKIAYYAVRNVVSVFDDTFERVKSTSFTHKIEGGRTEEYTVSTDRSISVYGYQKKQTGKRIYTIWKDDAIPGECLLPTCLDFAFCNSNFENPVLVDVITGNVYQIPKEQWERKGSIDFLKKIPVYDGPVLVADCSLIQLCFGSDEQDKKAGRK